jgi:FeS assembly SUF system regulator
LLTLSKLSDYAIVLMTSLARREACTASAQTLADGTQIPLPTVIKLLKILAADDIMLLQSIQGRKGGYRLMRPPSRVSLAAIIEAVDGPIAVTECNRADGACRVQGSCVVQNHWLVINRALRRALTDISLADLTGPASRINDSWRSAGAVSAERMGGVVQYPVGTAENATTLRRKPGTGQG